MAIKSAKTKLAESNARAAERKAAREAEAREARVKSHLRIIRVMANTYNAVAGEDAASTDLLVALGQPIHDYVTQDDETQEAALRLYLGQFAQTHDPDEPQEADSDFF